MFAEVPCAGGVEGSQFLWLTVRVTAAVSVTVGLSLVTGTGVGGGEMVAGLPTQHD